jgi:hypothetical protein
MHPFRPAAPLEWRQVGTWKTAYELYSGDHLVATLRNRSTWSSEMVFTTHEREWSIRKHGFWKTRVFVRAAGAEADTAVFAPASWSSGGRLDFGPGRHFRLEASTWRNEMKLFPADSPTPIVTVKMTGVFKSRGLVTLHPSAATDPDVALLVAFPFYRLLDTQRSAAAIAAT